MNLVHTYPTYTCMAFCFLCVVTGPNRIREELLHIFAVFEIYDDIGYPLLIRKILIK